MIPKPLYEAQPYICIFGALIFFTLQPNSLLALPALLLYCAGVRIWVKRAGERGQHSRHLPAARYCTHHKPLDQALDHYSTPFFVPPAIYEHLPFVYLLLGYLCTAYVYAQRASEVGTTTVLLGTSGALLLIAGLACWIMRGHYRGYHRWRGTEYDPLGLNYSLNHH